MGHFFGFTEDKMLNAFVLLLTFYGAASGLQSQEPVVCKFAENQTCYVNRGQQVHMPIPSEDWFNLFKENQSILKYRKSQSKTPTSPRWQFDTESNTMILTSVEWSDFGTYSLFTFDTKGSATGTYTLQIYMKDLTLIILSSVCASVIVLAAIGFFVYKKRRRLLRNKQGPSQNGKEIYAQVIHSPPKRTDTKPSEVQAQDDEVKYAVVNTRPTQRNEEKKEQELQYSELKFSEPSQKNGKIIHDQDKCVYSQIQYGP